MKEYNDKLYQTRDEHGNVKVAPKNVTTNNMKKGFGSTTTGHLFSSYKYQGSPYDQKREQELQEKMIHKAKIIGPFNGGAHPSSTFTPHYQTFYCAGEPYQRQNDETQYRNKTVQKWTYNNPNKKGLNGTFTEFPKYIE